MLRYSARLLAAMSALIFLKDTDKKPGSLEEGDEDEGENSGQLNENVKGRSTGIL